jgi:hypothetical protein
MDKRIVGSMGPQGWNYDSDVGCSHNTGSDKRNPKVMPGMDKETALDVNMSGGPNPGVDRAFLAKGNPTMDTTGWGKLTRSCED